MKGAVFAFIGGACITLQGVANTRISKDIGTWQAAAVTQMTGFVLAFLIFLLIRIQGRQGERGSSGGFRAVKPLYLFGGALGAVIIFSEVTAMQKIGITFTIAALLIAQLLSAFLIDSRGWFGVVKQKIRLPQAAGIGLMIAGIVMMKVF
ncbi:DMT family transporter [Paenibacillus pinistramenti]|uniref:DMT family transporter n=1 Tax=Paenibacillus pinistramenti TaxID=1768003 RepID=UPI001107EA4A|nr:DMT family transporter [Paenibacillus pinistramenti]